MKLLSANVSILLENSTSLIHIKYSHRKHNSKKRIKEKNLSQCGSIHYNFIYSSERSRKTLNTFIQK